MGIERFFSSIEENDITNLQNNFTYKLQKKINTEYLLIDFNSIVHITGNAVITDLNYLLYQIIKKTFKQNPKVEQLIKTYNINLDINAELKYSDLTEQINQPWIDNTILDKVKDATLNILNNFINSKTLQYLLIAADGVPHIAKMMEQKKRRYMGTIIDKLKMKIFQKYEDDLATDEKRYIYEKNKFHWSKIHISPGTPFKEHLNDMLYSDDFKKEIEIVCPDLKSFIYSGSDQFGEGEKKIMDYLYNKKYIDDKNNITVYSPDSDMTLLCLILSNKFKNIKIIRHNQQENNYDIIDIDLLRKNMFNYVLNSLQLKVKKGKITLSDNSVISDLVFVLTIFGNDFLPKLESFSVRYDFTKIIDKYVNLLKENKMKYIIQDNQTINQYLLLQMIKLLHYDEGGHLQKIYMINNYQNYDKLKKIMNIDKDANFTLILNEFLSTLRKFNEQIRKNKVDMNYWIRNEKDFINKMIKLTRFQLNSQNPTDHYEFIQDYQKYYKDNNKLPEVRVTFNKYSKSLKSTYHRERLEKTLDKIDPKLKITKYDEEIFKLDNMLDEYIDKLNATSLNIGFVTIDPKSLVWKTEKIEKGVKRYYYDFFGINDISMNNPEMKKIINEYLEGLMWVYHYYFDVSGSEKPSIWYYKYTHAPLLTQIHLFLKDQPPNYLYKLLKGINKYEVDPKDYFKPKEHLMYTSPVLSYPNIIPEEYKDKLDQLHLIDMNKIIDEIWTSESSDEIDCRGVLFLNKCHVNEIHTNKDIIDSYNDNKKFLSILRTS